MNEPIARRGTYVAPEFEPQPQAEHEWFEWNRTLQVLVAVTAAALVFVGSIVGYLIGVNS